MFSVALLAGGLATRLRPLTEKIPKALISVAGKPFILRQLEYMQSQGISRVVICSGYLGKMIFDFVNSINTLDLEILYSDDGKTLLGTGGAIKKAIPLLGDNFFIIYGDAFLPINFLSVQHAYLSSKKPALMTVLKNQNMWDKSNVLFRDGELIEYNKITPKIDMDYIDYGLGIVSASIFEEYPDKIAFDLAELYHYLSTKNQLAGFEVFQRFYEIGNHTSLKEAEEYFILKEDK